MGLNHVYELWKSNDQTKGAARAVLLVLAIHCREEERRECWPSLATIAKEAGLSRRQVIRAIYELEAGGQIIKAGRVAIRRMPGSKDRALRQWVNVFRLAKFTARDGSDKVSPP